MGTQGKGPRGDHSQERVDFMELAFSVFKKLPIKIKSIRLLHLPPPLQHPNGCIENVHVLYPVSQSLMEEGSGRGSGTVMVSREREEGLKLVECEAPHGEVILKRGTCKSSKLRPTDTTEAVPLVQAALLFLRHVCSQDQRLLGGTRSSNQGGGFHHGRGCWQGL